MHKGKVLKQRIEESGVSITRISKISGFSRNTIYLDYERPDVPYEHLAKIGKAIGHDFRRDFPEFRDPEADENITWKVKYLELLEKHLLAMEENARYLKERKK